MWPINAVQLWMDAEWAAGAGKIVFVSDTGIVVEKIGIPSRTLSVAHALSFFVSEFQAVRVTKNVSSKECMVSGLFG